MGKFRQCLTELSACDTIMARYYRLTFLFLPYMGMMAILYNDGTIESLQQKAPCENWPSSFRKEDA